ncbi:hypothetical protein VNO77_05793 [Canavalia gladiata]|uniref:Secreted protein n=1 Tax=Canavalia gladiata TaxID=3824 RepID=A0AAN9N460_CANGL
MSYLFIGFTIVSTCNCFTNPTCYVDLIFYFSISGNRLSFRPTKKQTLSLLELSEHQYRGFLVNRLPTTHDLPLCCALVHN